MPWQRSQIPAGPVVTSTRMQGVRLRAPSVALFLIFNDRLVQMCKDQGSPGIHSIRCVFAMPALVGSKPVSTSHVPVPHGHEVHHTHCAPGVREAGLEQRSSGAFHCRSVCPLSFLRMPAWHGHEVCKGSRRSQRSASRKELRSSIGNESTDRQ